jgi:phage N-6-adenine-methyltransferase
VQGLLAVSAAAAAATHAIAWRHSTTAAKSTLWATPPAIYLPLDKEFGFTVDIAADPGNAKHQRFVTKDVDALSISWRGHRVYCNPPYGRAIGRWLEKGCYEVDEGGCEIAVFLLPARTGNIWFHDVVLARLQRGLAEVRFIKGRLSYKLGAVNHRKGRATFDSMVVIIRPPSEPRLPTRQLLFPFAPRSV